MSWTAASWSASHDSSPLGRTTRDAPSMKKSNSTTRERSKSYSEISNGPQRQQERDCSGRSKQNETVAGTVRAVSPVLVALHLVFGQSHDCGIRSIGWFLELSEFDAFIASSFGSQQKVALQVKQFTGQFGQQEVQRLGQQMPKCNFTLCEDETFHPQICLVAIEPVSNFLILEAYAEKRDAVTWMKPNV